MAFTSGEFGSQAAKKPTFRFDQNPSQNSGGGVTGKIPWIPPAPAPVGSWRQPPAPAQAPYQAPAYQAPQGGYAQGGYDMQPTYGGGSVGGGGGGGGQMAAPIQRLTADDFAAKYKNSDNGLALTDTTFADQQSQYAKVLKEYIADYDRNIKTLDSDTKVAREGIGRNRENGLTSQAEDFFARGMGNSGVFAQEQQKAGDQYTRQDQNVKDAQTRQTGDLKFRRAKFEGENGANGSNVQAARRDAYNRLALKQQLI